MNPDPNGNSFLNHILPPNPTNNVANEPIKITGARLIGPIKEPIPPK